MNNALKTILKKDSVPAPVGGGTTLGFKVGNASVTANNSCEMWFEGKYQIPAGRTATVIQEILQGLEGGGGNAPVAGIPMVTGTQNNVPEGTYDYVAQLGNSGQSGVASTYRITVTLDTLEEKIVTVSRTSFYSVFWDQAPC